MLFEQDEEVGEVLLTPSRVTQIVSGEIPLEEVSLCELQQIVDIIEHSIATRTYH